MSRAVDPRAKIMNKSENLSRAVDPRAKIMNKNKNLSRAFDPRAKIKDINENLSRATSLLSKARIEMKFSNRRLMRYEHVWLQSEEMILAYLIS